jgi:hypothetical protein
MEDSQVLKNTRTVLPCFSEEEIKRVLGIADPPKDIFCELRLATSPEKCFLVWHKNDKKSRVARIALIKAFAFIRLGIFLTEGDECFSEGNDLKLELLSHVRLYSEDKDLREDVTKEMEKLLQPKEEVAKTLEDWRSILLYTEYGSSKWKERMEKIDEILLPMVVAIANVEDSHNLYRRVPEESKWKMPLENKNTEMIRKELNGKIIITKRCRYLLEYSVSKEVSKEILKKAEEIFRSEISVVKTSEISPAKAFQRYLKIIQEIEYQFGDKVEEALLLAIEGAFLAGTTLREMRDVHEFICRHTKEGSSLREDCIKKTEKMIREGIRR